MLYNSLLVIFRLIAGLMSNNKIVLCAVFGIIIYVVWAGLCAFLSFGHRFYKKCDALTEFVKSNDDSEEMLSKVTEQAKDVSVGLGKGVSTYAKNRTNTPSAYISQSEALDSKVRGGIFNHGKSLMRAYINFTTILLLIVNLEFFGADKVFTASVLAQSAVLPVVYYFIIKLFYFLYNVIQQQFYKLDVESLSNLTDALDEKFGRKSETVVVQTQVQETASSDDVQQLSPTEESEEKENGEEQAEAETKTTDVIPEEPQEPVKTIDDYDFFKKKNIDVEKLKGEIPANSSVMPYIDVDSDYVIKDDENIANSYHPDATNGSEVLGGMLHNMSGVKKEERPVENTQQATVETKPEVQAKKAETSKSDQSDDFENIFSGLESFEVNNDVQDNAEVEKTIEQETKQEEADVEDATESDEDEKPEEPVDVSQTIELIDELSNSANAESETPIEEVEPETTKSETPVEEGAAETAESGEEVEDNTESQVTESETSVETNPQSQDAPKDKNIASIVGKFKTKSKLSGSRVVIERNDKSTYASAPKEKKEVQVLDANNDADTVLSSFKNSTNISQMGQESFVNPYEVTNSYDGQGAYVQPNYQGYGMPQNNFVGMGYNGYTQPNYLGDNYQGGYSSYVDPNQTNNYDETSADIQAQEPEREKPETPAKKPKRETKPKAPAKPKTKTEKPKVEEEEVEEAKRRGRPAKQVFDENVSIKDDAEFEQVLSRAEKLMRKSEEGLSPSQSKRVEKELKSLLEAMNRYKEGK